MARPSGLVVLSVLVHGALAFGVGQIEIKKSRAATAIEYAETQKKKPPPPEPTKVEDAPPPEKTARAASHRPAAPTPAAAAPEPAKSTASAVDALPDFGLSLSGGVGGTGIALPAGGAAAPRERVVEKVVRKAAPLAAALPTDDCDEPPAKPKVLTQVKASYTDDAIAAAVEGKVRLQITVDESGNIVDVKVVQGLGHGLDESAIAAARRMSFEPAVRCGKPARATFKLAMAFQLPH